MGAKTKIEWSESTWNPVVGCTPVSAGCDHCYAETLVNRFAGTAAFPNRFDVVTTHPARLDQPLRWRRPRKVFVNSLSDVFHKDIPDDYLARVWAVMALTPRHTFQVLTKRHGRMRALLTSPAFHDAVVGAAGGLAHDPASPLGRDVRAGLLRAEEQWATPFPWPLPNVHLGVSVEDQRAADLRVPALLGTPAAVRFLSCEPLLGPVDLGMGYEHGDWVIVGGESGPGARPMHPEWARSLRDQCQAAGVPFYFKQWGDWAPVVPDEWRHRRESDWLVRVDGYAWPLVQPHGTEDGSEVTVRRVGKTAAGRELDGRTWDEVPVPVDVAPTA